MLWFFSQTAAIISRNSRTGSSRVRRVKNTPAVSSSTAISEMPMPPPTGRVNKSPQSKLYTVSIKWDILRSLLLCDYFIIIQYFRFVNQKIQAQGKQKIRTLLLSRKGSDFHCLVRIRGLEPPPSCPD